MSKQAVQETKNLRPLADKVVIRREEAVSRSAGGIYFPDQSKEKPRTGTVVAVGEGRYSEFDGSIVPLRVSVGDVVVFRSYSADEINLDGEEYVIISEDGILAIVDT